MLSNKLDQNLKTKLALTSGSVCEYYDCNPHIPSTYKVVQTWPGHMRLVYTEISPGQIWTTLY